MRYTGLLYRALTFRYAKCPLSGAGAAHYGGRFNAKGVATLYSSLSPETAIKEANQAGSLQPITLVSYEADLDRVFDCRNTVDLGTYSIDINSLAATDWRDQMARTGEASTQSFSRKLQEDGYCGLLVPSFANGATERDLNLVLWVWNESKKSILRLIDDENRLSWSRE